MGSSSQPKAAEMVEVDDKGQPVRGTRRTASIKHRDGRHSKERKTKSDVAPASRALPPAAEGPPPVVPEVKVVQTAKLSRSTTDSPQSPRKSSRPPSAHRNVTFPQVETDRPSYARSDPSYYGVSATGAAAVTQPASTSRSARPSPRPRPQSMYGAMPIPHDSRPPPSKSAYFAPPVAAFIPMSYPPISPSASYNPYFPAVPETSGRAGLVQRLGGADPIVRTPSASGNRDMAQYMREAEDARMMPPPYRRPGDMSPYTVDDRSRGLHREVTLPVRHRSRSRDTATFHYGHDDERIRVEALGSRRGSYDSDERRRSVNYEDKIRLATGYQEEIGGPTYNLTAATLRESQRAATSSRSTRSSGSRNESDYRRSATTQTTRSGSGGDADDITIRLRGSATVEVAGAKIQCEDGAELNLSRRKSIRNGSERSGSEYGRTHIEDRRSRDGRSANYVRSTSHSARRS